MWNKKITGSLAELHEEINKKGYHYESGSPAHRYPYKIQSRAHKAAKKRDVDSPRVMLYKHKDTKEVVLIKKIQSGLPQRRVNIRISPMLTKTREHATAATYGLFVQRKRKR